MTRYVGLDLCYFYVQHASGGCEKEEGAGQRRHDRLKPYRMAGWLVARARGADAATECVVERLIKNIAWAPRLPTAKQSQPRPRPKLERESRRTGKALISLLEYRCRQPQVRDC